VNRTHADVVLFDLDGTLTDPAIGITRSITHALAVVGWPLPEPPLLRTFIGPPLADAFASLGMTDSQVAHAITAYRDRYATVGLYENALIDGIDVMLRDLVDAGIRLAVATSKPEPFTHTILAHFGIEDAFSVVAGATLDQRRRHKDEVVLHALEHLGLPDPDRVVMVGDREHDVLGAAVHGVASIGVLWGYGSRSELEQAGARVIVATVDDLRGVLLGDGGGHPPGT
jgi:phosphoglycolate phosphatase